MANQSILNAFSRMWEHVENKLSNKSDKSHTHTVSNVDNLQSTLNAKLDKNAFTYDASTGTLTLEL